MAWECPHLNKRAHGKAEFIQGMAVGGGQMGHFIYEVPKCRQFTYHYYPHCDVANGILETANMWHGPMSTYCFELILGFMCGTDPKRALSNGQPKDIIDRCSLRFTALRSPSWAS